MAIIRTTKPGKMLKTLDIEIAVANYFNPRVNLIVPNISWGMGLHECDLLILTPSGCAYEIEIKISLSDLKKDMKKLHNHGMDIKDPGCPPWPLSEEAKRNRQDKIRFLYFTIPDYLLKHKQYIPKQAGILSIGEGGFIEKIREAKVKSEYRFTDEEKFNVARLGTMRIWKLKSKLREMRDVAKQQVNSLYG